MFSFWKKREDEARKKMGEDITAKLSNETPVLGDTPMLSTISQPTSWFVNSNSITRKQTCYSDDKDKKCVTYTRKLEVTPTENVVMITDTKTITNPHPEKQLRVPTSTPLRPEEFKAIQKIEDEWNKKLLKNVNSGTFKECNGQLTAVRPTEGENKQKDNRTTYKTSIESRFFFQHGNYRRHSQQMSFDSNGECKYKRMAKL